MDRTLSRCAWPLGSRSYSCAASYATAMARIDTSSLRWSSPRQAMTFRTRDSTVLFKPRAWPSAIRAEQPLIAELFILGVNLFCQAVRMKKQAIARLQIDHGLVILGLIHYANGEVRHLETGGAISLVGQDWPWMSGNCKPKPPCKNIQKSVNHREVVIPIRFHRVERIQPGCHLCRVHGLGVGAGAGHQRCRASGTRVQAPGGRHRKQRGRHAVPAHVQHEEGDQGVIDPYDVEGIAAQFVTGSVRPGQSSTPGFQESLPAGASVAHGQRHPGLASCADSRGREPGSDFRSSRRLPAAGESWC